MVDTAGAEGAPGAAGRAVSPRPGLAALAVGAPAVPAPAPPRPPRTNDGGCGIAKPVCTTIDGVPLTLVSEVAENLEHVEGFLIAEGCAVLPVALEARLDERDPKL